MLTLGILAQILEKQKEVIVAKVYKYLIRHKLYNTRSDLGDLNSKAEKIVEVFINSLLE